MPTPLSELTLSPTLYAPSEQEVKFFKSQTGIESEDELKEHVLAVQREAWEVVHYLCIRAFGFMNIEITGHPRYLELLQIGKERPGAIFLELASFFGCDARKAIADGYPVENVVASDVEKVFWELGHRLFKSTLETFPVPFIQCDVLDPQCIAPRLPFYSPPSSPRPDLKSLTSLMPLQGHVSCVHIANFFHLFDEDTQLRAARALASLLSPEHGSMIFGIHIAEPVKGLRPFVNARGERVFCHSPESWRALWDGVVFEKGTVEVFAELEEKKRDDIKDAVGGVKIYEMVWSVKCV